MLSGRHNEYEQFLTKFSIFEDFQIDKAQLCEKYTMSPPAKPARIEVLLFEGIPFDLRVIKLTPLQATTNLQLGVSYPIGVTISAQANHIRWLRECFKQYYQEENVGDLTIQGGIHTLTIANSLNIALLAHLFYLVIPADYTDEGPAFASELLSVLCHNKPYAFTATGRQTKKHKYLEDIYLKLAPFVLMPKELGNYKARVLETISARIKTLKTANIHVLKSKLEDYASKLDQEMRALSSQRLQLLEERQTPPPETSDESFLLAAWSTVKAAYNATADTVTDAVKKAKVLAINTELETKKGKFKQAKNLIQKLGSSGYALTQPLPQTIDKDVYDLLYQKGWTRAVSATLLDNAFRVDSRLHTIIDTKGVVAQSDDLCPVLIAEIQSALYRLERHIKPSESITASVVALESFPNLPELTHKLSIVSDEHGSDDFVETLYVTEASLLESRTKEPPQSVTFNPLWNSGSVTSEDEDSDNEESVERCDYTDRVMADAERHLRTLCLDAESAHEEELKREAFKRK